MPDSMIPMIGAADAAAILARQRAAAMAAGVAPTARARIDRLRRLEAAVRDATDRLVAAISADFGHRCELETIAAEIVPLRGAIAHACAHLASWMRARPRRVGMMFRPASNWIEYQPLGVVGIVAPWNYPVFLTLGPLVDVLAAGNRAMIKPSEFTPRTGAVLRDLLAGVFDADEVAVVEGDVSVGRAFCALVFDHLVFTGSTSVGRAVMAQAAENLVPVTLELGGKSPVILGEDAKPGTVARSVMQGKLYNAGQTCIAPDYVLAPRAVAREFAQAALAVSESFFPTLADNPDYTTIISDRHRARLLHLLDGLPPETVLRHRSGDAGRRFAPTIVLDPPLDSPLMTEEIFGPILPVIGVDSLDEAIAFVNARPRPLALYCYSADARIIRTVLDRTISGGVTLNATLMHCAQPDLPFGGVGPSGMGAYHGRDGFERFSHARAIHRRGVVSGFEMVAPPYGRMARGFLGVMKGRKTSFLKKRSKKLS